MSIEKNTPSLLKHEQSPFTTLLNETINQIKDPAALGIYCYLASKPNDWEISTKNLMNHFGKGRDFIKDRLKYLRSIGALVVNDVRDEKGRFISRETLLKRTIPDSTVLKNPTVDNPDCGKSSPTNKREIQNQDKNKNIIKKKKMEVADLQRDNLHNIPEQLLDDWIITRKSKRAPVTRTAWARLQKTLALIYEKKGIKPIDAFEEMVANGWQSLKPEYFDSNQYSAGRKKWTIEEAMNA